MDKVYMVKFDWSTPDSGNIDLYAFNEYGKAYDKFKQLIADETNPDNSWVGDIQFNKDGYPINDDYIFEFNDNNSGESELWWHITDKGDWFIELIVLEVQ